MDDNDLIARARHGDERAWEMLVQEYQQPIFRLAYLLLAEVSDAEDVAQETFIRAFRALDTFDGTRPLRPWLLSIASNVARNRRRSLRRYWQAITRTAQLAPPPQISFHDRSAARWQSQELLDAVRCLSRIDQEIIYLRYFLELSESETASALGIAPGTAKSRLHRAVMHLRAIVDRAFPQLREERLYE